MICSRLMQRRRVRRDALVGRVMALMMVIAAAPSWSVPVSGQDQKAKRPPMAPGVSDASVGQGPSFFAVRGSDRQRVDASDADVLHRRISLTLIGVPLGMAVQGIADRAGLEATFSTEIIPLGARVSMKADDVTVASALRWVLVNSRLDVLLQADGHLTLVPRGNALPESDSSGVLAGVLVNDDDGHPVAYATAALVGTDRARFADAGGSFRFAGLAPGSYKLRARQIGYSPADTTIAVSAGPATTTVTIRMHLAPALLRLVEVHGHRPKGCVATGVPDSTVNPALAAVFAQIRENVDRYDLLLEEYPFRYRREESALLRRDRGGDSVERVDTVSYDSREHRPYRVGGMIYRDVIVRPAPSVDRSVPDSKGRGIDPSLARGDTGKQFVRMGAQVEQRRYMYLPTFRDLADPGFLAAHCFDYAGGSGREGSHPAAMIRVNFRPASAIKVPDVSGSVYLDARRFVVQRAVFEMTHPEAADPPVIGFKVTTTFRELLPLLPVIDSVESEQSLPPIELPRTGVDVGTLEPEQQVALGSDRLLGFAFEGEAPGEPRPVQPTAAATAQAAAPPDTSVHAPSTSTVDLGITRAHAVFPTGASCPPGPAVDTLAVLLYASVHGSRPAGMPDTAWSQYEGAVLAALSRSFDLPGDLALMAFSWPFEHAVNRTVADSGRLVASGASSANIPYTPGIDSSNPPSGTLAGNVFGEDGRPVPYATVLLVGASGRHVTDSSGAWRVSRLFPGAYVLRVRRIGYAPRDTTIVVRRGPAVTTDTIRIARAPIRLAVVSVEGQNAGPFVAPMMSTVVAITLGGDGSLRNVELAASSASHEADTLVLSAVQRAAVTHEFPQLTWGAGHAASTTIELVVSMGEPARDDQAAVVGRLDVPAWPSRGEAGLTNGVNQPDIISDLALNDRAADTAALEFIVNERGRPLTPTARMEHTDPPPRGADYRTNFAKRMIQSLPRFRFDAAHIAGCAVPQFVLHSFGYRISKDAP
jgi:protocatechuate 3,4-dioxygenase beta subunit